MSHRAKSGKRSTKFVISVFEKIIKQKHFKIFRVRVLSYDVFAR